MLTLPEFIKETRSTPRTASTLSDRHSIIGSDNTSPPLSRQVSNTSHTSIASSKVLKSKRSLFFTRPRSNSAPPSKILNNAKVAQRPPQEPTPGESPNLLTMTRFARCGLKTTAFLSTPTAPIRRGASGEPAPGFRAGLASCQLPPFYPMVRDILQIPRCFDRNIVGSAPGCEACAVQYPTSRRSDYDGVERARFSAGRRSLAIENDLRYFSAYRR